MELLGGAGGGETGDEAEDPVEGLPQLGFRHRVAESYPTVVTERGTGHEGDSFLFHEPGAEIIAAEPGSDAVDPEKEVERAVRLGVFDAGRGRAKALHQDVAALP